MYTITWLAQGSMPDEIAIVKVQYLADIPEVVRDAFGCDDACKVVITKEDYAAQPLA